MIRIPAIDIINGTCVRLTKGEFDKSTRYNTDPILVAKRYEDGGATHLHVVDLDAARGLRNNYEIIVDILHQTNLKVQIGGGIKERGTIDFFMTEGADAVVIGSLALTKREVVKNWVSDFGSDKIIIGADVRNRYVATDGWLSTSEEDISDFIYDYMKDGAIRFLCTDIQKDGMLQGTANALYVNLVSKFEGIQLIASGGVSGMEDIHALEAIGVHSCVIGKALFERRISLTELYE